MSNKEITTIIDLFKDTYNGNPWFGRSVVQLLEEVNEKTAYQKPAGQHSIVELLWHMITWREFTIDQLQHSPQMSLHYFEDMDWRELDHADMTLWKQGLERLAETQVQLMTLLQERTDDLLEQKVAERDYDFRKLLYGITHHDIYHIGQIAYLQKFLRAGNG